jgi:hypothetical protein
MNTGREIEVHVVHTGTKVVRAPAPIALDSAMPLAAEPEAKAIGEEEDIYRIPARGGAGGGPFEFTLWDKDNKQYHRVAKLELWIYPKRAMRGVQVTYDNGYQQGAGKRENNHHVIELHCQEKELITTTVLYAGQYRGSGRAFGIDLRTDWGQRLHEGVWRDPIPYTDDTRGTLIGVYGRAGVDIDQLGLILELPQDEEYVFEDISYDLSECKTVGETPISLKEETINNQSAASVAQQISFSHTHSDTKTWGHAVELKAGVKTSIKTGVPFLAEGQVELSLEASYTHNWGGGTEETKTDMWTVTVNTPPYSHLRAVGTVTEAEINVPYVARIRKRKSDGTEEVVDKVSGVYSGVNVSKFDVKVEDLPG